MIKIRRYPGIGRVAVITLRGGRQVISILACSRDAIVTTRTGAHHLKVIYRDRRNPYGVVVAVLADVGCTDMFETLAGRGHAVVTGATGISGRGMIEARRQPGIGRVTVVALCGGRQVIKVLALSDDAIVTADAGAHHLEMIYRHRRNPGSIVVTVLADIGRTDMVERLAGGGHAVMTGATGISGRGMIEVCR